MNIFKIIRLFMAHYMVLIALHSRFKYHSADITSEFTTNYQFCVSNFLTSTVMFTLTVLHKFWSIIKNFMTIFTFEIIFSWRFIIWRIICYSWRVMWIQVIFSQLFDTNLRCFFFSFLFSWLFIRLWHYHIFIFRCSSFF